MNEKQRHICKITPHNLRLILGIILRKRLTLYIYFYILITPKIKINKIKIANVLKMCGGQNRFRKENILFGDTVNGKTQTRPNRNVPKHFP